VCLLTYYLAIFAAAAEIDRADYTQSTKGRLTLHFLPGYAPDLNPDELVWSHVKRTGAARTPLRKGERLRDKIDAQLAKMKTLPRLIRSFFKALSVADITDCRVRERHF
jgi:transposase